MKVLYIGRFGYPTSAAGIRVSEIADQLVSYGVDVEMICCTSQPTESVPDAANGKKYIFVNKKYDSKLHTVFQLLETLFYAKAYKVIKERIAIEKPVAVVLYNDVFMLTKRLIPYCRKHGIRIVGDVTEWYEMPTSKNLNACIIPFLTDKRIRKLDCHLDSVISISPYLKNYYHGIDVETAFVPPLVKLEDMCRPDENGEIIRLVYAGSPGEKDILLPVIKAVASANKLSIRVQLDIYGDVHLDLTCVDNRGIRFWGIVNHDTVIEALKHADFSFLIRRNLRYAKAGFSTKLVECMSHGVAMICNSVGGADTIISHGIDGLIIDDMSEASLLNVMNEIMSMGAKNVFRMRMNAYEKARGLFSAEQYGKTLRQLIIGENNKCQK